MKIKPFEFELAHFCLCLTAVERITLRIFLMIQLTILQTQGTLQVW